MKLTDISNSMGLTNVKSKPTSSPEDNKKPSIENSPAKREVLFSWEAMSRPMMKSLDQKKVKNLIIIGIVISLMLVAMQEFFLILGILSLIFVSYMLMQAPQERIKYQLTNQGIMFGDMFYSWANTKHFFFTAEGGVDAVAIDLFDALPARLYMTLNKGDKKKVMDILEEYVFYLEQEPKSFVSKAYDSVMDKLDLEAKS